VDDELGAIVKEREDLEEPAAAIETGPQLRWTRPLWCNGDGLATMNLRQARVGRRVRLAPPGLPALSDAQSGV
jgi:hypothetical protein